MKIHAVHPLDTEAIIRTLLSAFRRDPLTRWIFSDDADYNSAMKVLPKGRVESRFELINQFQIDDSPVIYLMARQPRYPNAPADSSSI